MAQLETFLDRDGVVRLKQWVDERVEARGVPAGGKPGQVVGFGADGSATTVQGWSNPNLLINADFRTTVDSEGLTVYKSNGGSIWSIDKWRLENGDLGLKDDCIHLSTLPNSSHKRFYQKVDLIEGELYTASALVKVDAAIGARFRVSCDGSLMANGSGAYYFPPDDTIGKKNLISVSFLAGRSSAGVLVDSVEFFAINNEPISNLNIEIYAIKLELGSHQTLAHQDADGNWVLNDPPPAKNVESLKCQPMTTTDLSGLIYQCAYPTNKLIFDSVGKPGAYVYIPKFRLCDVLSTSDTSVHPAFIRDGKEVDGFWMGKFQSHVYDGRAYSLPREDPSTSMTLDQAVAYNRAKGDKFHEVTVAEWSAIALWCHKNGTEPKGNNNYGKDISEATYKAVPSMARDSSGRIQSVATGTGPVTWSHDGTLEGVWDINGNVWEWCSGLRLVKGELQVIPYNNAADPTCDLSATSTAWKAIKAAATSWDDLFVTPDGNGTTQGTVKLDWDGTKWTYSTTIAHEARPAWCTFASVTADASIGDKVKLLLMALAMLPDTALTGDGIAADYNGVYFTADNAEAERCMALGGSWAEGTRAGVFRSSLEYARSVVNGGVGGRSAYQE